MSERLALKNIPFTAKLVLVPLLAVLAMALLGVIVRSNSQDQVQRLQQVVHGELNAVVNLGAAADKLNEANGALYYLMTTVAAGGNADVERVIGEVMASVDGSVKLLAEYRDQGAQQEEREQIDGAIEKLGQYREAVEFVGSMLELDFNSAVAFVAPFQANYRQLNTLISEIVAKNVNRSEQAADKAAQDGAAAIRTILITILVATLAVAGIAFVLARATVGSIRDIAGATLSLAEGNLDIDLEALRRQDELGDISRSLITFKQNAIENQRLQQEQVEAEARRREQERKAEEQRRQAEEDQRRREAELAETAQRQRREEMLKLSADFESSMLQVVDILLGAAAEMEKSAAVMSDEASKAMEKSDVATAASKQSSENTQTVASAAQQLYASIKEITGQVSRSSTLAQSAVGDASKASERIKGLEQTADKVSQVMEFIGGIASQTNLLALNATIESARAGEAGKGFAVVASEVKTLATQTAKATEEISEQVADMQNATREAVAAIDQILKVMSTIESTVTAIAGAVQEQDASTAEIARTVDALSGQAVHVTENIVSMQQSTETTGTVAMRVLEAARELSGQSNQLKHKMSAFLENIRAA